MKRKLARVLQGASACAVLACTVAHADIGDEVSEYERLEDGQEFAVSIYELLRRGEAAFDAMWTTQEGGGRPLTKGTGGAVSDPSSPLIFPNNFNRISAQDSNGCAGCHNAPFGLSGGGGDFVTGVFVAAQRFDHATFDHNDFTPGRGAMDESGRFVTLQNIGNYRATLGMFGSGFIEMLARQMTTDLRNIRDATPPGGSSPLYTKGVSFGTISRDPGGNWDVSQVDGLPPQSLTSSGPSDPPSMIIHPFHQSGSVVSLRQFTNNAFNHHHGMQSTERFGEGVDADGDGFVNELTRADITAVSVFQAALPVPQQVAPKDRHVRKAIKKGERLFESIGCADCHVPALPLTDEGWIYTEPNPYNPPGNLQVGEAETFAVDLTDPRLPGKRPQPKNGVVWVRAFTDLKLHDITSGPGDPGEEAININHPGGSDGFFAGNREFLTKKLWGAANERPYFHHGKFTTLRSATLAHDGDAVASRQEFQSLSEREQDMIVEFLKSLQVVAPRN
ncbi:MAG: thiol oxidoreductase [Gammaproteobacteria bacterium]|nr:thiol oxidoreductase [Gammaproteobacteria bacterium]